MNAVVIRIAVRLIICLSALKCLRLIISLFIVPEPFFRCPFRPRLAVFNTRLPQYFRVPPGSTQKLKQCSSLFFTSPPCRDFCPLPPQAPMGGETPPAACFTAAFSTTPCFLIPAGRKNIIPQDFFCCRKSKSGSVEPQVRAAFLECFSNSKRSSFVCNSKPCRP